MILVYGENLFKLREETKCNGTNFNKFFIKIDLN